MDPKHWYQHLRSAIDTLIEQGPPARLAAALPQSRLPRGAQQFALPRIMLPLSGSHAYRFSQRREYADMNLEPGDAIFTAPMAWTKTRHAGNARLFALVCHPGFSRYLVFDTDYNGNAIESKKFWLHTTQDTTVALRQALLALGNSCSRDRFHVTDLSSRHLLYSCLLLASEELSEPDTDTGNTSQVQWRNACAYIDEYCQLELSRNDIAEVLSVHPNHVARIFRQCNDHFPSRLEQARMNRATALLSQSTTAIKDVASRCGFQSSSYFIRRFKIRYGMTPEQYRHESRQ